MDSRLKRHCSSILEALIKHPASWAFLQPVDPEKLNIPDYFSVVSSPMDLGTVRTKLQDNMYLLAEEFKDDVRLTFSNAMLYNPPDNFFHKVAKKLYIIFYTEWKSLEARLKRESIYSEQSFLSSGRERKTTETKHLCPRSALDGENICSGSQSSSLGTTAASANEVDKVDLSNCGEKKKNGRGNNKRLAVEELWLSRKKIRDEEVHRKILENLTWIFNKLAEKKFERES